MTTILPYIILLFISAALSIGLAIYVVVTKPPSGRTFRVLLVAVALWALAHAGELLSATTMAKIIVVDVMYIAISLTVLSWLGFAVEHSGNAPWITSGRVALFSAFFALWLPVIWTNPVHHLFFREYGVASGAPFPTATHVVYGPLFWVYVAYSYSLQVAGLIILLRALLLYPHLYRGQIAALLIGALVPFGFSIAQVFGLNPNRYIDVTPLGFSITGVSFAWAVLHRRLFNIVPIARDMVIENMTDGVIVLDAESRVVDVNPAGEKIVGVPAHLMVGQSVEALMVGRPDLVERYRGVTQTLDQVEIGQGDERRTYELRISPIYNRRGELTGRLVGLRDVTDSIQLQRQLQNQLRDTLVMNRVLAAVSSSLDLKHVLEIVCRELAQALDLPQAAVAVLNDDGTCLTVMAEYLEEGRPGALNDQILVTGNSIVGMVLEQRRVLAVTDVRTDPRAEFTRHLLHWRGVISILIVPIFIRDRVLGLLSLDALQSRDFTEEEIRLAESVAVAVSQALESARLYEALQEELAERRRTQAELVVAKEFAEAASHAKSSFLANMSHELRTPLNSITGYTDLLLQGVYGPLTEKQVERLTTVRRNSTHLLNLINDVLDLSKIEAGRVDLSIRPLDVAPMLAECAAAVEPQALGKGLAIYRDFSDDLPLVMGDAGRVRQVVTNLLSNAVKFTNEGSVTLSARVIQPGDPVSAPQGVEAPAVLIAVKDTGIGVAPGNHELVFEEFRQVDSSSTREFEGTGLGLAIVRRLVTLMGGHVWLESELGKGSVFFVTLPLAPANL